MTNRQSTTQTERALPLVARTDLVTRKIRFQSEPWWVVKDPLRLKYVRLDEKQFAILNLLDGTRCVSQIRSAFMQQFPGSRPETREIYRLVFDLFNQGLVWSNRPGQAQELEQKHNEQAWKARFASMTSLMFIRLPGWDPQRFLDRCYPHVRLLFHPVVFGCSTLLILLSVLWVTVNIHAFHQHVPSMAVLTGWNSLALMWLVIGATKIVHELGHGFACRHFGGECHEIGVAFLIFSPCLYCDVSDAWILSHRWQRIAIAAAGMFVELTISAMAFFLWLNTNPGWLNLLLFHTFAVTTTTVVLFNLNPLLRLDGYYILSDWLEMPNLRSKANRIFGRFLGTTLLGIEATADSTLPHKKLFSLGLFALASAIYRWTILFTICFILHEALKPYQLQSLGILLGVISIAMSLGVTSTRIIKYMREHQKQLRRSRRPIYGLAFLVVFTFAFFAIPVPWYRHAECRLEPVGSQNVYAGVSGRLKSVNVNEGDLVRKGQILARLLSPAREDRYRELRTAIKVQEIEVQSQRASGDIEQLTLAEKTLQSIQEELTNYRQQLQRTVVVAPCSGRVVEPTWRSRNVEDPNDLPSWSGTPLSVENVGCTVDASMLLCSITPQDAAGANQYQAVVEIDQFDREDFIAGSPVRLKAVHLPKQVLTGRIEKVAAACKSESANHSSEPKILTAGTQSKFQAIVSIQDKPANVSTGMPAKARVLIGKRTAAQWCWRYMRASFSFAL